MVRCDKKSRYFLILVCHLFFSFSLGSLDQLPTACLLTRGQFSPDVPVSIDFFFPVVFHQQCLTNHFKWAVACLFFRLNVFYFILKISCWWAVSWLKDLIPARHAISRLDAQHDNTAHVTHDMGSILNSQYVDNSSCRHVVQRCQLQGKWPLVTQRFWNPRSRSRFIWMWLIRN